MSQPGPVELDQAVIEALRNGTHPPTDDQLYRLLKAWRDIMRTDDESGWYEDAGGRWRYAGDEQPEYAYSDPVPDIRYPRITVVHDQGAPDAFPPGWGSDPTERDRAAIEAGNA